MPRNPYINMTNGQPWAAPVAAEPPEAFRCRGAAATLLQI